MRGGFAPAHTRKKSTCIKRAHKKGKSLSGARTHCGRVKAGLPTIALVASEFEWRDELSLIFANQIMVITFNLKGFKVLMIL